MATCFLGYFVSMIVTGVVAYNGGMYICGEGYVYNKIKEKKEKKDK